VQVIEDDIQRAAWKTLTETPEGIAYLLYAAPRPEETVEVVAMDIIESQEVLDAMRTMVGGTHA
jgi:hypothetical protein